VSGRGGARELGRRYKFRKSGLGQENLGLCDRLASACGLGAGRTFMDRTSLTK
jgi:hypothetical protein